MASKKTDKHVHDKDPEKTVDVPPYGSRNADPLTDSPGSHPVETGIGAVLGGVASGLAVGAVGGPVGAVIGGIAGGALAGGLAGKGVGELIDPTTEDNWLREYHSGVEKGTTKAKGKTGIVHDIEDYRPAYRYGIASAASNPDRTYTEVEPQLRRHYESDAAYSGMKWDEARSAVRDAYDRTLQLREERLKVDKAEEQTGEVKLRKEVRTEHQTVSVPVQKEEVVIERRAVNKTVPGGITADARTEEVRIPVREEKVKVGKETVIKEEVSLGKRKVQETERVGADLKKEELKVEETGKARVKGDTKKK